LQGTKAKVKYHVPFHGTKVNEELIARKED